MQEQGLTQQKQRKSLHISPGIFVVALWLPVLLFTARLMTQAWPLFTNKVDFGGRDVLQLAAEDEQFRIYVLNEHLKTEEAEWLLQESNRVRSQLVTFLQLEDHGRQITIRVYPYGQSQASMDSDSVLLVRNSWRASTLYHELTHALTDWSTFAFRMEGIAILAESRLAGRIMPPHPWWALDAGSMAMIEVLGFPGLQKLDRPGGLHVPLPSQLFTRLRFYWLAGSFTGYLVDEYGWEKYWDLYRDGQYEVVYGRTLAELEQEWLAQLAAYKRIRYTLLTVLGLLCVALLAGAARQPNPWRRALAIGTPGLLALAAATVPAPFPFLAAILLGVLGLLLTRQRVVAHWPRGVWWTAVITGAVIVIELIIVPGGNVVLRYT
ncbi:MAG: hypothetical protein KF770_26315 [Anaerolineae bacterium]|nr:hypothetical protein [Anaerolineae bacterium]